MGEINLQVTQCRNTHGISESILSPLRLHNSTFFSFPLLKKKKVARITITWGVLPSSEHSYLLKHSCNRRICNAQIQNHVTKFTTSKHMLQHVHCDHTSPFSNQKHYLETNRTICYKTHYFHTTTNYKIQWWYLFAQKVKVFALVLQQSHLLIRKPTSIIIPVNHRGISDMILHIA